MYLNTIWSQKGRQISPHLVAIRWTPSAIGYIATPAFARKVLQSARSPRYNSWVDIIFEVRRSMEACWWQQAPCSWGQRLRGPARVPNASGVRTHPVHTLVVNAVRLSQDRQPSPLIRTLTAMAPHAAELTTLSCAVPRCCDCIAAAGAA
jgi:hypothetical protein